MRSLLVAALMAAGPASADWVMKTESGYVRLSDGPCHQEIREQLKPEWQDAFRSGWVVFRGKDYKLCWLDNGGHYVILDEDGDVTAVPKSAFKQEGGV